MSQSTEQSEAAHTAEADARTYTSRWLADSAMVIASVGAALLFTGWSYMSSLLGAFGLEVGLLGLGETELALMGVVPTIFALWQALKQFAVHLALQTSLVFAACIVLALYVRRTGSPIGDNIANGADRLARHPMYQKGLWLLGFGLALFISLGAGSLGAKFDERYVREAARKLPLCYTFNGRQPVAGVMLAQTKDVTVLKLPESTALFRSADLRVVQNCAKTSRVGQDDTAISATAPER